MVFGIPSGAGPSISLSIEAELGMGARGRAVVLSFSFFSLLSMMEVSGVFTVVVGSGYS